ncbi:MAG: hypothetical protein V3W19_06440, partial [Desulfatiglandales bacterium]
MTDELLEFIREIQSDQKFMSLDEAAIKQSIILKVLLFLGWDPFNIDEVHPEYDVGTGTVDFALMHDNSNKVFIDAITVGEELEKRQEKILLCAIQYGVKIAVLTNGVTWWFYLPGLEGDWEERKFYTLEMYEQDAGGIAQKFRDFLSKENVIFGKSETHAENMHHSQQINILIEDTLPRAWNKLISESEGWLVDLIAETAEELSGYRPDSQTVERFIAQNIKTKTEIPEIQRSKPPLRPKPIEKPVEIPLEEPIEIPIEQSPTTLDYTGKSIVSFTFKGERYNVNSWKAMLVTICEIMLAINRDKFEYVLTLAGPKRPYFTKDRKELLTAEQIPGTDVYVEANISEMGVVGLSRRI